MADAGVMAVGRDVPIAPCRGQSRGMQNSQRVLLALPRTAVASATRGGASREARRPSIAPYRNGARAVRTATGHGHGARERGGAGGAQGHCVRIG